MFGHPARAHYLDTFTPWVAWPLRRTGLHMKARRPDVNGGAVGVWCRSGWGGLTGEHALSGDRMWWHFTCGEGCTLGL